MNTNSSTEMSATPDTNTPPPTVKPQPVRRPRVKRLPGEFNVKQLAQIEKLELLIPVCREEGAIAPLAERGVTEEFLVAVEGRIRLARGSSVGAANNTVGGVAATDAAKGMKKELMKWLRTFQTAARLKWQQSEPSQLKRYLIGADIDDSRAMLSQSAHTIIANTIEDHLPAITEEMITEAQAGLKAYDESPQAQRDEKGAAADARASRDSQVLRIIADRQQIQLAAESAWPARNPANAGWRRKFRLPEKRPYTA